ncbi:MAG: hypothetical protein EXR79_02265 [Myxococcales bacterium]|nr:hypothetical protein [Myxococcales bacterium]
MTTGAFDVGCARDLALVLDLDGVVLDVRASYRQAYLDGIARYLVEDLGLDARDLTLPTLEDVHALKRRGGFNAPEHTVAALLSASLGPLPEPARRRVAVRRDDKVALAWCHEAYVGSARFESVYGGTPRGGFPGLTNRDRALLSIDRPPCRRPLGVYTGRRRREADLVFDRWRFFAGLRADCVATPDDGAWKPDPAPLAALAHRMQAPGIIYFGDTQDDCDAVRQFRTAFPQLRALLVHVLSEPGVAPWPDADLTVAEPGAALDLLGA